MIRITLLIPTLDRSGAEKQLTLLATRLPRDEFDVHVVALTRGGPFEEQLKQNGIATTIIGKRFRFDPFALWRLKKLLAETRPDILHTWLFAANSHGRFIAGKASQPKVIVSERCVDSWKSGWQLWLDRRQIPRTARLVGNSAAVAEFYRQVGFPSDRIVVIPNGIETPVAPALLHQTNPTESDLAHRKWFRTEFNLPTDALVVGYAGRLAPQKRIQDLVWAMEILRQVENRAHFVVVGDGPERERLQRFAEHTGWVDRFRFVGQRDDVSKIMHSLDLFWLASDFEGQSNSLMEAMAAGVPVIASDIAPNRELIGEGGNDYLVKVGDRLRFAQLAGQLLQDRDLARSLGMVGRQRMQDEYNIDKMVDAYANLYREIQTQP